MPKAQKAKRGLPKRTGKRKSYHATYFSTRFIRNKLRHILRHNSIAEAYTWAAAKGGASVLNKMINQYKEWKPMWFTRKYPEGA